MTAAPKTTKAVPAKRSTSKKKAPRANAGATTARVEVMRAKALEMLLAGEKCPAIGAALGVTRERAWQIATEALALLKAETLDKASEWRVMLTQRHTERLQTLTAVAYANLAAEPALAVTALGKAKEIDVEIGKLWGAYAATKTETELTGANGGPVQTVTTTSVDVATLSAEELDFLIKIQSRQVAPDAEA